MKLGKTALLQILSIVQDGLLNQKDISQALRDLDLMPVPSEDGAENSMLLEASQKQISEE